MQVLADESRGAFSRTGRWLSGRKLVLNDVIDSACRQKAFSPECWLALVHANEHHCGQALYLSQGNQESQEHSAVSAHNICMQF